MGGGGSPTQTGTATTTQSGWGPSKRLWRDIYSQMFKGYDWGQTPSVYEGERVAPWSDLQTQAYGQYSDYFKTGQYNDPSGMYGAQKNAAMSLLSGKPAWTVDPTATMNLYESSIKKPAMEAWREEIMPGIQGQAAASGMLHSSLTTRELGRAGGNVADMLASNLSQLQYADEQSRRQAEYAGKQMMPAGFQMAEATRQIPYSQFGQAFGVGGQERAMRQEIDQAAWQKWGEMQPENSRRLQLALQMMGIGAGLQQTQTEPVYGYPEFEWPEWAKWLMPLPASFFGQI